MGIVKTAKLVYEYIRRDEEEEYRGKSSGRSMVWIWILKKEIL